MRAPPWMLGASTLCLAGCATIFNGTTQTVNVQSEPPGASVAITDRDGKPVHTGTAPMTVTLERGAGYFRSQSYKMVFSKPGFADKELLVESSISGWYIGNILFGGLIGMLAVDPATGAMYSLPESVSATLEAGGAKTSSAGSLTVVSMDTLTPQQRAEARLLTVAR